MVYLGESCCLFSPYCESTHTSTTNCIWYHICLRTFTLPSVVKILHFYCTYMVFGIWKEKAYLIILAGDKKWNRHTIQPKKKTKKQTETIRNRVIHYLDNLTKLCDKLVLVFLDTGINPGGPQSGSLEEGQTDVFLHTLSQLQPPEGLFPRCSGKVLQLSFSLCKTP